MRYRIWMLMIFFFNDTATTEIYTLSLHDALPISLLASAELLWRLNPRLGRDPQGPCLREVSRRHWNYGRWALAGAVFLWVPWNICYPLVTKFWGLAETGTLRALLNLALPITQAHSALTLLFLPYKIGR